MAPVPGVITIVKPQHYHRSLNTILGEAVDVIKFGKIWKLLQKDTLRSRPTLTQIGSEPFRRSSWTNLRLPPLLMFLVWDLAHTLQQSLTLCLKTLDKKIYWSSFFHLSSILPKCGIKAPFIGRQQGWWGGEKADRPFSEEMFAKLSVQSCASFDRVEECGLVHILEYRQYFILVRQSVCVEDCVVVVVVSIV